MLSWGIDIESAFKIRAEARLEGFFDDKLVIKFFSFVIWTPTVLSDYMVDLSLAACFRVHLEGFSEIGFAALSHFD